MRGINPKHEAKLKALMPEATPNEGFVEFAMQWYLNVPRLYFTHYTAPDTEKENLKKWTITEEADGKHIQLIAAFDNLEDAIATARILAPTKEKRENV